VDLGQGTTGRFHGLLHSGGRYVTTDPRSATECAEENEVVRRIAAEAVEDTGGFFVTTPADDPGYADRFLAGCRETGVPVQEIPVAEALDREPRLNPGISRAFEVEDASIDAWRLLWGNARSARAHGAEILTYHWVTEILRDGDRVAGAVARDERGGGETRVEAAFTINAGGVWAGQIADLAACPGVRVVPGKGIMIAMNHRLVQTVVNRCDPPGDGDILVPVRTVCVIGTTDVHADSPDDLSIGHDEVQQMLDAGEVLVPGFRRARALHAWTGSRPLFHDERAADDAQDTRHMSRGLAVVDHLARDGVSGFLTITGGKLTTYRLMAEIVVDAMCRQLGEERPCRTAAEALPGSEDGRHLWIGERLAEREADLGEDQIICECELMPRRELVAAAQARPGLNLDDVRRTLRLGMGPCQGGFCTYRAAGILHGLGDADADRADGLLQMFLQHRWQGLEPILYGDQMRQAVLDDWIFQGILDVEHLPAALPERPV
jgi:glycerol-3-phosphate dehydrogenase